MKRAYVGNIPFAATAADLIDWFRPHKVVSVEMILDRDTRRPKGFAFVEFDTAKDFEAALLSHNQTELAGRRIIVNDATKKRGSR